MTQITQKDIAAALRVSRETVTKALSGDPKVADDTRRAVLDKAGALGYTPNLLASSLASRRSRLVGVVVPHIAHPLFSVVVEELHRECRRRGYTMIPMITLDNRQYGMEGVRQLLSMRVAAMVLCTASPGSDPELDRLLRELDVPAVLFGPEVENASCRCVVPDDRATAFRAAAYALSRGYARPAFLCGDTVSRREEERRRGYLDAWTEFCPGSERPVIVPCGASRDEGCAAALRLLRSSRCPDFILTSDGAVALGVCDAARMEGLALPGQLGVVALDEPPTGGEAFVLTRTVFSAARIADAVVDQLFGALSGETGPVRRTVPGELLLGGSCR